MRAAGQFGLGFGFTLIVGSPLAFTVLMGQPAVPPPRLSAFEDRCVAPARIEPVSQPMPRTGPAVELAVLENDDSETKAEKTPLGLALAKLERLQSAYGFWTDSLEHESWLEEHGGHVELELSDTALTALCLLCLVQEGQTHVGAEQYNSCRIALTFLLSQGNGEGWYSQVNERNTIRTEALVMAALTRLATNSRDLSLEPVINEAVAAAESCNKGNGWGRSFKDEKSDYRTTAWMLCAITDDRESHCSYRQADWYKNCLAELEKQAKAEKGDTVFARAVFVSCVEFGSERSPVFLAAEEAVLQRANEKSLIDVNEIYWIARALTTWRRDGIWRDAIRAKAEAATLPRSDAEQEQWLGGECFRLALGIRTLQLLR